MLQELSERARRLRNDPEPRDMVRRNVGRMCMQSDARHSEALCVADITPLCEARQVDTRREVMWTTMQRPGVGVHRDEPFQRTTEAGECSLWRCTVMASRGHWKGKLVRFAGAQSAGGPTESC